MAPSGTDWIAVLSLLALGFFCLLCILTLALIIAAGGLQQPGRRKGLIHSFPSSATSPAQSGDVPTTGVQQKTLRVLCWNLSYAYGRGSDGVGYSRKSATHFVENLENIAAVLRRARADVVCLQEVDFDSSRSGRMNQLHLLAKEAHYARACEAPSWRANYVPFPLKPVSDHFGKVRSGGGILSQWPVLTNTIELLPKPEKNHPIYNWFYLFRYLQRIELHCGSRPLALINLHLEAFDPVNRRAQFARLGTLDCAIACGDFNMDLSAMKPGEIPERLRLARTPEPTFPSGAAEQTLDHFLYDPEQVECLGVQVLSTGKESDHRAIVAEFRLKT